MPASAQKLVEAKLKRAASEGAAERAAGNAASQLEALLSGDGDASVGSGAHHAAAGSGAAGNGAAAHGDRGEEEAAAEQEAASAARADANMAALLLEMDTEEGCVACSGNRLAACLVWPATNALPQCRRRDQRAMLY